MAEHIGIIEQAGTKTTKSGGTAFRMEVINPKWGYYLFKPEQKEIAGKNIGKRVKITFTETDKGRNVEAIEVMPDEPATPTNSKSEMNKDDWDRKQRIEQRGWIAKAFIDADMVSPEGWEAIQGEADAVFAWVYELPQNQVTKPQEGKVIDTVRRTPLPDTPIVTKDKPTAIPPAQGAKTKAELITELNEVNKRLKWTGATLRTKALELAKKHGWENGENIAQSGFMELDVQQLPYLVALMQTEVGKQSATK